MRIFRQHVLARLGHMQLIILMYSYVHGSMLRESNLIIVQQDAAYSVYYISVGSSTSGAGTTVVTAPGID